MVEYLNRKVIMQDIQIGNKHTKTCSILLVIRKQPIKRATRYPAHLLQQLTEKTDNVSHKGGWGTPGNLIHCWWECIMYSHFGKHFGSFLET